MELLFNVWFMIGLFIMGLIVGSVVKLAWFNKPKEADENNGMQLNVGLVAVVVALAVLFQLPSLSIDVNGIFTYAFDVVNAFMPLIAIIAGLGLGFNLIGKISSLFTRAL